MSILGMYRDTIDSTYVEVRGVWGHPDYLTLSWLDREGKLNQITLPRIEVERDLRAGILVRCYRRAS